MTEVSFILPCLNSAQTIEGTLRSILALEDLPAHEIVVVDNGCSDDTVLRAMKFPVRIVTCAQRGAASARNAGARASKGTFLAFVDSDVELDPSWLKILLEELRQEPWGVGLGRVIPIGDSSFFNHYRTALGKLRYRETNISLFHPDGMSPAVNTAACLYRRSLFEALKGFDERLHRLEDTELSSRVFLHGGVIFATSSARSYVRNTGNLLTYLKRSFLCGMGRVDYHELVGLDHVSSVKQMAAEFSFDLRVFSREQKIFYGLNLIANVAGHLFRIGQGKKFEPSKVNPSLLRKMLAIFRYQRGHEVFALRSTSRVMKIDGKLYFHDSEKNHWFPESSPMVRNLLQRDA